MPEPKAPYKLTVKLSSARPDAIGEALAHLRQLTSDHDLTGESTATLTIECFKESPLSSVREMFELWLYGYKIALDYVLSLPQWSYLAPLKRLRPLYVELRRFKHRKQKDGERKKDGNFSANPSRKGPLTLSARTWALGQVLAVQNEINASAQQQDRPPIDLINTEEESRIRELIELRTYPNKWSDEDPDAIKLIAQTNHDGSRQELLLTLEAL